MKYFDIVSEELLKNIDPLDLNKIFSSLNIDIVYIARNIKQKKDLEKEFIIPKLKNITLKKAYVLENISLIPKDNSLVIGYGSDISRNSKILNNKKIKLLLNPIGQKLIFDEESARLAGNNNYKIIFNINLWRNNLYNSLKQTKFIVKLLKKHKVDMLFCSLAKTKNELIDPKILNAFLLNLDLNKEIIDRFLDVDILCLKKK